MIQACPIFLSTGRFSTAAVMAARRMLSDVHSRSAGVVPTVLTSDARNAPLFFPSACSKRARTSSCPTSLTSWVYPSVGLGASWLAISISQFRHDLGFGSARLADGLDLDPPQVLGHLGLFRLLLRDSGPAGALVPFRANHLPGVRPIRSNNDQLLAAFAAAMALGVLLGLVQFREDDRLQVIDRLKIFPIEIGRAS